MPTNIEQINNQILRTFSIQKNIAKGISDPVGMSSSKELSFSDAMAMSAKSFNQQQIATANKVRAVDTGQSNDLVGAIVAQQKADLSFDALVQVRNKLVQAFDEVIKMPI